MGKLKIFLTFLLALAGGLGTVVYLDPWAPIKPTTVPSLTQSEIYQVLLQDFKDACTRGITHRCKLVEKLEAEPTNYSKTQKTLEELCLAQDRDDFFACYGAGELLNEQSLSTYISECSKQTPKYCLMVAGQMKAKSPGNPADATQYLRIACNFDYWGSCVILGRSFMNSQEFSVSLAGCMENNAGDCLTAAYHMEKKGNNSESMQYLEQGCSHGGFVNCFSLGNFLKSDSEVELLASNCTTDNVRPCLKAAGYYYLKKHEISKFSQFVEIACRDKKSSDCSFFKGLD